jgi:hypothetical protein
VPLHPGRMRSAHRYAVVRPSTRIRRDRQFNVSLTSREFELLHARAAACRLRPVDYGRARLFDVSGNPSEAAPSAAHLDPLFYAQLSRLGNLVNQIARRLNTYGGPAPASLEPLLRDIRALINRGTPS